MQSDFLTINGHGNILPSTVDYTESYQYANTIISNNSLLPHLVFNSAVAFVLSTFKNYDLVKREWLHELREWLQIKINLSHNISAQASAQAVALPHSFRPNFDNGGYDPSTNSADFKWNSVTITRIWTRNGFEQGELELIAQKQQESIAVLLEKLSTEMNLKTEPSNLIPEPKH